jgi:hypothetical protein
VVVESFSWELERIFEINHVHPKLRAELSGADGTKLVSWLLYAVGEEGRGIEKPLSFALNRFALSQGDGAGGRYEAYASLPPQALVDLILGHGGDQGWDRLMGVEPRRARQLLPILLGEGTPEGTRSVERICTKIYTHYRSGS